MCIALLTTAHPDYALILIDNRDEFLLRPTSRPHWWSHPDSGHSVLSSRDLHRSEKGTWLGITKDGYLAVLTNYSESQADKVQGARSRGAMVTAWLSGIAERGVHHGVNSLVQDGGTVGVGGFSMACGRLRRKSEGIAIVSNRARDSSQVPLVAQQPDGVWGLSNAVFDPSNEWPKVESGKKLLKEVVQSAAANHIGQDALIEELFRILDTDTLPPCQDGMAFHQYIDNLQHSIFVPPIGDEAHQRAMDEAAATMEASWDVLDKQGCGAVNEPLPEGRPDAKAEHAPAFETGLYGTQRQTVVLVDWEGNVTFVERALWHANGSKIPRGQGDVTFRFKIEGWED